MCYLNWCHPERTVIEDIDLNPRKAMEPCDVTEDGVGDDDRLENSHLNKERKWLYHIIQQVFDAKGSCISIHIFV